MSSNVPLPENERGRVLPFQRRGRPRPPHVDEDAPVESVEKYARGEPDDYRQRMINNGLGLLACILDRKSTLLNSSHGYISYAVFCLKKTTERQRSPLRAKQHLGKTTRAISEAAP